ARCAARAGRAGRAGAAERRLLRHRRGWSGPGGRRQPRGHVRDSHLRRRGLLKRWLKRGLFGLLGVVGALVAGSLAAGLYLHSRAGEEQLRRWLLAAANRSLEGRLDAGAVRLRGRVIVVDQVRLFAPGGELVASADRAVLEPELRSWVSGDTRRL